MTVTEKIAVAKIALVAVGAVALVAGYYKAKRIKDDLYQSGVEARTDIENAIISADDAMLNIPSAMGRWFMSDLLGLVESDRPRSYNWLEGNNGEWPGI